MVLISIHPFAVRKVFLLAIALLGLSSAACFADPLFMTQQWARPLSDRKPSSQTKALPASRHESRLLGRHFENLAMPCVETCAVITGVISVELSPAEGHFLLPGNGIACTGRPLIGHRKVIARRGATMSESALPSSTNGEFLF